MQNTHSIQDLDSIIVTVPSQYAPRQLSPGASPFVSGAASTAAIGTSATGAGASPTQINAAQKYAPFTPNQLLIFWAILSIYLFRSFSPPRA